MKARRRPHGPLYCGHCGCGIHKPVPPPAREGGQCRGCRFGILERK